MMPLFRTTDHKKNMDLASQPDSLVRGRDRRTFPKDKVGEDNYCKYPTLQLHAVFFTSFLIMPSLAPADGVSSNVNGFSSRS